MDPNQQQQQALQQQQQAMQQQQMQAQQQQVVQQQVMAVHDGSGGPPGGAGVAQHMGMMTQNPQAITVVASSMGQQGQPQPQQVAVSMQQPNMAGQQAIAQGMPAPGQQQGSMVPQSQSGSTTITTMSSLHHPLVPHNPHPNIPHSQMQQLQVIQQPLQNGPYIQPLYNTQGQLIMPGNIALHPSGMNHQIQVIAARGKTVLQTGHCQAPPFSGYTTIPTTTNQTLLISNMGVISSQPNLLQAQSAQNAKPQEMQKLIAGKTVVTAANGGMKAITMTAQQQSQQQQAQQQQAQQHPQQQSQQPGQQPGGQQQQTVSLSGCVVSQPQQYVTTQAPTGTMLGAGQAQIISPIQQGGQPMQFTTHWPIPQNIWTPGNIPGQTLLPPNHIIIRNATQQDGSPGHMFIQSPPPQAIQAHNQQMAAPQQSMAAVQQMNKPRQAIEMSSIQPKIMQPRGVQNILPSQGMRPASSVSTQTGVNTNTAPTQVQSLKGQAKVRTKMALTRGPQPIPVQPAPSATPMPNMQPGQKNDAGNQTKMGGMPPLALQRGMMMVSNGGLTPDKQQQQQQQQVAQAQMLQAQQVQQTPPKIMGMQPVSVSQVMQPFQMQLQAQPQPAQLLPKPSMGMVLMQQIPAQATQAVQQTQQAIVQQVQQAQHMSQQVHQQPQLQPTQSQIQQSLQMQAPQQQTQSTQPNQNSDLRPVMPVASMPATPATVTSTPSQQTQQSVTPASGRATPGPQPAQSPVTKIEKNNGEVQANGEEVKLAGPPKAMVKPQVLTHVIEGYVIQEASEPFPVGRPLSDLTGKANVQEKDSKSESDDEPPKKKLAGDAGLPGDVFKCETCGKLDHRTNFYKSKPRRFCTPACAKSKKGLSDGAQINGSLIEEGKNKDQESMDIGLTDADTNSDGPESSHMELTTSDPEKAALTDMAINPLNWTVADVCEFIRKLPGCTDYAEDFAIQEIDGQALMLLKEDHLMSAMAMKLGPALKICAKIDTFRIDSSPAPPPTPPATDKK